MSYVWVFKNPRRQTAVILNIQNSPYLCNAHVTIFMPLCKVWIYRLLFVFGFCLFVILCVSTVEDFSAEDKPSSIKSCMVVHRRPGQKSPILGTAPPEAENRKNAGMEFGLWAEPSASLSTGSAVGLIILSCSLLTVHQHNKAIQ